MKTFLKVLGIIVGIIGVAASVFIITDKLYFSKLKYVECSGVEDL